MPDVLLVDTINMELGAQEPWPQLITLYQPYEVEQILLPDNANCLAVQAFLKMCGLEYTIEPRRNAEYMSPSGRVPFIRCGAFLVPEFDTIVTFIGNKGTSLSEHLALEDKADMRAYISLVNNVFINAEQYICWVDETTLNDVTKIRHGSVYPWPLNHILNWHKRNQVIKKLSVLGWYNKTLDEVLDEVEHCCIALSERLEGTDYFFGNKPTELDALIHGHICALIKCKSYATPSIQRILMIVSQFPKLIEHSCKISTTFSWPIRSDTLIPEDFVLIKSVSEGSLWDCSDSLESLPTLSDDSILTLFNTR